MALAQRDMREFEELSKTVEAGLQSTGKSKLAKRYECEVNEMAAAKMAQEGGATC
jgi:hypothetical protein